MEQPPDLVRWTYLRLYQIEECRAQGLRVWYNKKNIWNDSQNRLVLVFVEPWVYDLIGQYRAYHRQTSIQYAGLTEVEFVIQTCRKAPE